MVFANEEALKFIMSLESGDICRVIEKAHNQIVAIKALQDAARFIISRNDWSNHPEPTFQDYEARAIILDKLREVQNG